MVLFEDWSKRTDDEVYKGASEQPGSQAAYWRDTEMRRREYVLNQKLLTATIEANAAQREAIEEQKLATAEMRRQSRYQLWAVLAALATAAITLVTSLVH